MGIADIIILLLIAGAAAAAVRFLWRSRKQGCSGCCADCAAGCKRHGGAF